VDWTALLRASETPSAPDLLPLAPPAPTAQPYARRVLHSVPAGELLLIRWSPGRWTLPHDHGHAGGEVWVLQGWVEETGWREDPGALTQVSHRRATAGGCVTVRAGQIHAMRGHDGAVTLHRYWPQAQGMRVFQGDQVFHVPEGHGAWAVDPDLGLVGQAIGAG
jgi:predicted metal-dependent enzyme (double-stranded beta helix superfamily)